MGQPGHLRLHARPSSSDDFLRDYFTYVIGQKTRDFSRYVIHSNASYNTALKTSG